MEELQDAIEDAQYVNAINTQDDGPKPVLPWETPSSDELLVEWSKTKARSLGNLDSFLEQSAICVFLFSSFIKQHHDDYVRLNFCEDVLRFKKLRGRSRRKQAQAILEHYILVKPSPPPAAGATAPAATTSTNPTTTAPKDATNNGNLVAESAAGAAAWAVGTTQLPPRTEIDECDLERIVNDRQSTHAYLKEDATFRIYCDYPKCSQSLIGIRDAILDDLIDDWREWEEKEKEEAAVAAAKSRHPPSHHGSNGRRASASSTASGDFTTTNTTTLSSSKPRSTRRSSGGSTGGGRSSSVEPPNTTEETTADGSASASTDATVPTANPTTLSSSGWNQPQPPPQQQQQPQVETLDPNTDATKPEESAEAKAVKDADTAASSSLSFQSSNHGQPP